MKRDGCSPRPGDSRTVLVCIADHNADNGANEDNDNNDERNDEGSSVLAPQGGLLACVHDGGGTMIANVVRFHDSARGRRRRRVVAFQLGEARDGLRLGHDRKLGQRVRYRLGVLRVANVTGLRRRSDAVAAGGLTAGIATTRGLMLVGAGIAVGGVALVRHVGC